MNPWSAPRRVNVVNSLSAASRSAAGSAFSGAGGVGGQAGAQHVVTRHQPELLLALQERRVVAQRVQRRCWIVTSAFAAMAVKYAARTA